LLQKEKDLAVMKANEEALKKQREAEASKTSTAQSKNFKSTPMSPKT